MNECLSARRNSVGLLVMRDKEGKQVTSVSIAAGDSSPAASVSTGSSLDPFWDAGSIARLFQCSICSRPFDKPVVLSCGNSLCTSCLPKLHERLFQCSICFQPFDKPVALPCGNSLCSSCLPKLHERQYISYPNTPDRLQGFICPFIDCRKEHAAGDFTTDFTLKKAMDVWNLQFDQFYPIEGSTSEMVDKESDEDSSDNDSKDFTTASLRHENCLSMIPTMTAESSLSTTPEVGYQTSSSEEVSCVDISTLNHLKDKLRSELQCLVCYSMYLDPVTTGCGHTFCRKCLERVLDHSSMCPVCRKLQNITTTFLRFTPNNRRLTELLTLLFPDELTQRAALGCLDEEVGGFEGGLSTPLFVCTLSFPGMPTFLHIFEPRYRLMVRRAWQGNKRFGMVLPNRTGHPQGDLGVAPFKEFGTLLEIKTYQLLPDGRSWIETIGISRFRVKRYNYRDAYIVADVETIEDLPIAEEEHIEARETSPNTHFTGLQPPLWTLQSTHQLFQIGRNFVNKMRMQSPPCLSQQAINVYGPPPEDPAIFPYWLAIVLPIAEDEQYQLLSCDSVRGRLKIIVGWIKRIEGQQW